MAEAGWYADPQGPGRRCWDGAAWTEYTAAADVAPVTDAAQPALGGSTAPYGGVAPAAVDAAPAPYAAVAPGYGDPAAPYPVGAPDPWAHAQVAPVYGQPAAVASVYGPPAASAPWPPSATLPPAPPVGVWRGPVDDRPWVQNMADAVRVVLHKYAQFDGRAGRPEFWYWTLSVAVCYVALLVCAFIPFVGFVALPVLALGGLAIVVPGYAVIVRRLRDAGFGWPWIFLALVPLGGIAVLILCAQPSKYP